MKAFSQALLVSSLLSVGSLAAPLCATGPVADTWTGAGSDSFFSDGTNWSLAPSSTQVAPANSLTTAYALFTGTATTNQPQLTASQSIAGLTFNSSGWTLSSSSTSNILTLGLGDGTAAIDAASVTSGTDSISANLSLGANIGTIQTFAVGTGGTLSLSGVVSGSNSKGLAYGLSGDTGTITVSGANTYTAANSINFGTVQLSGSSATLGSTANALSGNSTGTLDLNGQSLTVSSLGGSENITNNGSALSTLTISNEGTGTFAGTISDGSSAKTAVSYSDTGTGTFTTANSYSGGTSLNSGTLRTSLTTSLGSGAITLNGGTLLYVGGSTVANNFAAGSTGTITNNAVTLQFNGAFTASGTITFNGSSGTSGAATTLNGSLSGYTGTMDLEFNGNNNTSTKTQHLALDANSANALGTAFVLGAAAPGTGSGNDILDYVGANSTAGLVTLGSLAGNAQGILRNDTGGTTASTTTFTIGGLNTNAIYTGQITDSGTGNKGVTAINIAEAPTYSQTLAGFGTYTGGTTVTSGTLNVTGGIASSGLTTTAATSASETVTVASTAGLSVGQVVSGTGIPSGDTIIGITSSTTFNLYTAATVASGASITANAAGPLGTSAATVNGGTLNIGSATALQYVAPVSIQVNSGGAMTTSVGSAGTATVNSSVTVAGGGSLGFTSGTLGTLTINNLTTGGTTASALTFNISGTGGLANAGSTYDTITDNGNLTLNTSTSNITTVTINGTVSAGTYDLITVGGVLSGTVGAGNNLRLGSTTLNGDTLSLALGTGAYAGDVVLNVSAAATSTRYTLAVSAGSNLLHAGETTTLTSTITNTGGTGADTLNYTVLGASSSLGNGTGTTSGGGPLANSSPGNSGTNSSTYTATTAGTDTVTSTVGTATNGSNGTSASLSGTAGTTTINVYSGQSTWTGTGTTGIWGSFATGFGTNWGTSQGSPGLDANYKGVDTATFGAVTSNPASYTVNLNDAAPNLNKITFNAPNTSYTIAQGPGYSNSITLSGTTPSINVAAGGGSHTISAPIILGATTSLAVASGQSLTISGQVSGTSASYGLSTPTVANGGGGKTVLSNSAGNTYGGGTTINAGTFYANNATGVAYSAPTGSRTITAATSGSATGTGGVTVASGGTFAGTGTVAPGTGSGGVVVQSGGTLASGGVQSNASPYNATSGLTINNAAGLSSVLSINAGSALQFALGAGTTNGGVGTGALAFGTPNTNSSFLNIAGNTAGEINFDTAASSSNKITIDLVDLTTTAPLNTTLTLRSQNPYLLIQAGSNSDYDLITSLNGVLSVDGNGYVVGIGTSTSSFNSNPFNLEVTALGSSTAINTSTNYENLQLYLYNGDLEVVPEPGTWAMMLGGLALLVVIQRRRTKRAIV